MTKTKIAIPEVISHVYQLASIILFFSIVIISFILWQIYDHNKINKITRNYHQATIHHVDTIQIEILHIKNKLKTITNSSKFSLKPYDLHKAHHEIVQSLHIINQNYSKIYSIQDLYRNIKFQIFINQLQSKLPPLLSLLNSSISTKELENNIQTTNINTIQLTLEQLGRTHKIANSELSDTALKQEKIRVISIIGLFLVFLLAGIYITIKTSDSIKLLLKKQKNTEERLSNEKRLSHTTLNSIGDAVITTDNKGLVNSMNPVAESLSGWSNEEAKGLPLKTIFPIINATSREPIDNPVDKVLKTGEIVYLSNHTTLISKDGTEYQIADSAAPICDDNEILGMVLVFNDVTEQYQMREKIRSTVQHLQLYREQAPLASIEWNTDFQIIDWNLAAERIFGYTLDEVKGRDFVDIMLPENAVVDVKQIWNDLISQTGGEMSVNENLTKDGQIILCEWHNTPLIDESGTVIGASSIVQDITERRIHEEQLRRTQKMDALGKLTGGVAHDYNNMLGVIMGFSELLEGKLKDQPKLSRYANEIQRAAKRGAKLTRRLLTFSRKQATDKEKLDLNLLLQDTYNMLEKSITARISLALDLQNDLWQVHLDQSDLEDAILNLSINAMHAIEGNGNITIQTRNEIINETDSHLLHIEAGEYVLLSITDTGCGMDNETREKIFDPFFTTKGEKGTGLGLSQVYGFVERSQGVIKLYTETGHGTRFILYFPRYQEKDENDKQEDISKMSDVMGCETILVVDDEKALLNLTYEILNQQGYRVLCAESAKQALEILETNSIDLLISDIIMPEMDGYQLAAIVQKKYPSIKIQLASGFADERHVDLVDNNLHNNLLHKPFNSQMLLKQIRNILDSTGTEQID